MDCGILTLKNSRHDAEDLPFHREMCRLFEKTSFTARLFFKTWLIEPDEPALALNQKIFPQN